MLGLDHLMTIQEISFIVANGTWCTSHNDPNGNNQRLKKKKNNNTKIKIASNMK